MREVNPSRNRVSRFDDSDQDVRLKRALETLQTENIQLRKLVVRLSETIIRNVTDKR